MDTFLNIRTLALLMGLVSITLAAGLVYFYLTRKTYPGFFCWVIGSICCGVGSILLSERGHASELITVVIANLLIVLFYAFVAWGMERFTGTDLPRWPDLIVLAVFAAAFLFFTFGSANIEARILIVCLVFASFCIKSAWTARRLETGLRSGLVFWTLVVIAVWNLVRAGTTMTEPWGMTDFMTAGTAHGLAFVVVIVTNILLTISFLQLNHNRVEAELQAVNTELRDSEERMRSLSDATFEGIAFLKDGVILEANRALCAMFGCDLSELIGKTPTDFLAEEERAKVRDNIQSGFEGPYETVGLRCDGSTFPIEARAKMFGYRGEEIRVAALRDLTDEKKAEEEIDTLRAILPICAFCKKIRDDQGYWNQVEDYFNKHSGTEFTHGVCLDCMAMHYPDAYRKIIADKKDPEA